MARRERRGDAVGVGVSWDGSKNCSGGVGVDTGLGPNVGVGVGTGLGLKGDVPYLASMGLAL